MVIKEIKFSGFRAFENVELKLEGKSTILFGVNGMGKTSVLRGISLIYAGVINSIPNHNELKTKYLFKPDDIHIGSRQACIQAQFLTNQDIFGCDIYYKGDKSKIEKSNDIRVLAEYVQRQAGADLKSGIPVFVNYGTNRFVIDTNLKPDSYREFDIFSAYEKVIDNKMDFQSFFEWYRNQEDYENQRKIESGNLNHKDRSLEAVRMAMLSMPEDFSDIRIERKPRVELKIKKNNDILNFTELSDGEKCILAMFGDLARRLALANPNMDNPLEGEGVVLIDEIELHLHPTWQRKILKALKKAFPNIQFIITTHSPIVLSEINDDYNIYYMYNDGISANAKKINRMDGYDAKEIMERFMGISATSENTKDLIHKIHVYIGENKFEEAQNAIDLLAEITDMINPEVIYATMQLKRRQKSATDMQA